MSKRDRRERRNLKAALRLWPHVRRYWAWLLVIIACSVAFGVCDAERAKLVEPLLNQVESGSGDIKGHAEDVTRVRLQTQQTAAVDAIEQKLGTPTPAGVKALQADPDLRGVARVEPEDLGDDAMAELVARTSEVLAETAERVPVAKAEAWHDLTHAVALQEQALARFRGGQHELGAQVSMRSREAAHRASFVVVRDALIEIVLLAIGLALGLALFGFLNAFLSRALEAKILVQLQNATTQHMLTLSVRFFEGDQRGDTLSRLTSDLTNTSMIVSSFSYFLFRAIQLGVLAFYAVRLSPWLCVALALLGIPLVVVARRFGKAIRRGSRLSQVKVGSSLETVQQLLTGIREVKAFQRESYELKRVADIADDVAQVVIKVVRARVGSKSIQGLFNDLSLPLLFLAGGYVVLTRALPGLTIGKFGAFLGLVVLMYIPVKAIGIRYNNLLSQLPSLERVFELLDRPSEQLGGSLRLEGISEGIAFENVGFAYGDKQVLSEISFEAERGSMTALVGHTGAGKSTLVDLIARYADPTQGRITIDGNPLSEVEVQSLLNLVAIVPQDSFLFNDTVRENIRYGRLEASDAEVEAAAQLALIHDDILGFPEGYDTLAGERGGRMSGGQIQRIAIARAMLKKPEILILDEAMSALDTKTEKLVQQAIDRVAEKTTTFVIAHRLSTVEKADRILVLEKGRVIEQGRHDELLAQGGAYANLIQRQLSEPTEQPQEGDTE